MRRLAEKCVSGIMALGESTDIKSVLCSPLNAGCPVNKAGMETGGREDGSKSGDFDSMSSTDINCGGRQFDTSACLGTTDCLGESNEIKSRAICSSG